MDTLQGDVRAAGLRVVDKGGIVFKPLANFQFDRALKDEIVGDDYLNGCFELGKSYPDLCASVYVACSSGE